MKDKFLVRKKATIVRKLVAPEASSIDTMQEEHSVWTATQIVL